MGSRLTRYGLPRHACAVKGCSRRVSSVAYNERSDLHQYVCWRHILVYRVPGGLWQAEDEWWDLPFARRSRFRWLAQRRILRDQRYAEVHWALSRAQARLYDRAVAGTKPGE